MKPVRDIELRPGMTVSDLISSFSSSGGFTASEVWKAAELWKEMVESGDTIFLSFPACIVATGTRGVLVEVLRRKLVDVVITTCGTLDHDLARLWAEYYCGTFDADDTELAERDIHRIGSVFVPAENYGKVIERKLGPILRDLRYPIGTRDLVWEIGKRISDHPGAEKSLTYWAWKNRIPVFIPGITDGSVGSQLWMLWEEGKKNLIDVFADEHDLSDVIFSSKSTGAVIVGGGISKHHTIWWNQFRGGLDRAVYLTTAGEYDGSLSGARPREAVSWKKLKPGAGSVCVFGDATLTLPLIVSALVDSVGRR